MNKAIGMQLIGFGALAIGLGCLAFFLASPLGLPTLLAGLVGGTLCLVAGFRAVQGITRKSLPLLTLIPLNIVLVSQTILTWGAGSPEIPERRSASVVVMLLLALSYIMLMRVAYAGVLPVGHVSGSPLESGRTQQAASTSAARPAGDPHSLSLRTASLSSSRKSGSAD